MTLKNDWLPGQTGLTDAVNDAATTVNAHDELITSGRLSEPELSAAFATSEQGAKADAAVPNTPAGRSALATSTEVVKSVTDNAGKSINGFGDVYGKIRNQQQDVNILLVGDSTLDLSIVGVPAGSACSWALGLAAEIAAEFPTHTVEQRTLTLTGSANTWAAATSVQTGAGYRADLTAPKKITLWVAGWSGHNWPDFFMAVRRNAVFVTPNPDVIVFGLGHNDPTGVPAETIRGRVSVLVERARTLNPRAQIILSAQNPRVLTPGETELRNDIYRDLARQRGWGYINVTQAFYDDGRSIAAGGPLTDSLGVHPTTAGAAIWRGQFMSQLRAAKNMAPIPIGLPTLTLSTPSLTPALSEWTKTNVTDGPSVTITDNGVPVTKATKTASGAPGAQYECALPLAGLIGQTVTLVCRLYIPTGANNAVGQLRLYTSSPNVLLAYSIAEYSVRDEWFDVAISARIPEGSTGNLLARILVDQNTDSSTPTIYIAEPALFLGSAPFARAPRVVTDVQVAKRAALQAMKAVNGYSTVTNYFVNASAENTLVPMSGLTTGTVVGRTAAWAKTGACAFMVTCSGSTLQDDVVGGLTAYAAPAVAGQNWAVAASLYNPQAASRTLRVGLRYLRADGSVISSTYFSSSVAAGADARVSGTLVAPTDTAFVVALLARPNTGGAALGDVFYVDDVVLSQGTTPLNAPGNADSDPLFYYEGVTGASRSIGLVLP